MCPTKLLGNNKQKQKKHMNNNYENETQIDISKDEVSYSPIPRGEYVAEVKEVAEHVSAKTNNPSFKLKLEITSPSEKILNGEPVQTGGVQLTTYLSYMVGSHQRLAAVLRATGAAKSLMVGEKTMENGETRKVVIVDPNWLLGQRLRIIARSKTEIQQDESGQPIILSDGKPFVRIGYEVEQIIGAAPAE